MITKHSNSKTIQPRNKSELSPQVTSKNKKEKISISADLESSCKRTAIKENYNNNKKKKLKK